jgi:hypothetical protein
MITVVECRPGQAALLSQGEMVSLHANQHDQTEAAQAFSAKIDTTT